MLVIETPPAFIQNERGCLGLSLAGKHALFIPADPGDALPRGKIGKVPDVLADDEFQAVQFCKVGFQEFYLILFGEHDRWIAMHPRNGIGTKLGEQDRLVETGMPLSKIRAQPLPAPALLGSAGAGVIRMYLTGAWRVLSSG